MTREEALDFFDYANRTVFRGILQKPENITFHPRIKSGNVTHTFRGTDVRGTLRYTVKYDPVILVQKRRVVDLMLKYYTMYHRKHDEFRYEVESYYKHFVMQR